MDALAASARALGPELSALRRTLHQQAEIGLHLPRTQATVLEALAGCGLDVRTGRGTTSVVGVLRGSSRWRGYR